MTGPPDIQLVAHDTNLWYTDRRLTYQRGDRFGGTGDDREHVWSGRNYDEDLEAGRDDLEVNSALPKFLTARSRSRVDDTVRRNEPEGDEEHAPGSPEYARMIIKRYCHPKLHSTDLTWAAELWCSERLRPNPRWLAELDRDIITAREVASDAVLSEVWTSRLVRAYLEGSYRPAPRDRRQLKTDLDQLEESDLPAEEKEERAGDLASRFVSKCRSSRFIDYTEHLLEHTVTDSEQREQTIIELIEDARHRDISETRDLMEALYQDHE